MFSDDIILTMKNMKKVIEGKLVCVVVNAI